jgi:hypothetical protein
MSRDSIRTQFTHHERIFSNSFVIIKLLHNSLVAMRHNLYADTSQSEVLHAVLPSVRNDVIVGPQRWRAELRGGQDIPVEFNAVTKNIGVSSPSNGPVFFLSPGSSRD